MLYALILTSVIQDLGLSREGGGLMASLTLGASAVGGLIFGVLADKLGRTRALMLSILLYSVFTFACGPGAERVAVRDLPRPARPRHGRRVGERRHARQRDLAGEASRQGARHHAELLGDRLRPGRDRRRDRAAAIRLAGGVLRRHPSGALHALDSAQREGTGDVDGGKAARPATRRGVFPGPLAAFF